MIDYLSNYTGWQGTESITQGQAAPVPGPLDKEGCLARGTSFPGAEWEGTLQ